MPSVISGDANVSATEFGFLDGVTSSLQSQIDSKLPLAGGKILQIVRATDSTTRTTTSTSFVDVTGMSVTITPQKSDSAVLIVASFVARAVSSVSSDTAEAEYQITDSSNNAISGAQQTILNVNAVRSGLTGLTVGGQQVLLAYATPATTSSVTYKMRFRAVYSGATAFIRNTTSTGQMYAIEVSA